MYLERAPLLAYVEVEFLIPDGVEGVSDETGAEYIVAEGDVECIVSKKVGKGGGRRTVFDVGSTLYLEHHDPLDVILS